MEKIKNKFVRYLVWYDWANSPPGTYEDNLRRTKMKIKDFLTNINWIQGDVTLDIHKNPVSDYSPFAQYWPLLGMIFKVYYNPQARSLIENKVIKYIGGKNVKDILIWNNRPERTFKDVRELIKTLDI